jgi:hypothetical protein
MSKLATLAKVKLNTESKKGSNLVAVSRTSINCLDSGYILWQYRRVYPKVSGLASWSENCKWYSSQPLGAIVSLFCESV